jgi:hypothetical protein
LFGKKKHSTNMMFTVMLLCIFALAAIFVAVLGAKVYANSAEKLQANFDTRTSIVYLSEKIRTCPGDAYDVREVEGAKALVLSQEVEGTTYESWIYVYHEELCEAVIVAGDTVSTAGGQQIMPLKSLDAEIGGGGIRITVVTTEDEKSTTFISGRTGL